MEPASPLVLPRAKRVFASGFNVGIAAKYIAVLGVALATAAALAGAAGARRWGWTAYEASAAAALLNWAAGSMALATVVATRHSTQRVSGALLAMMARMALPMFALAYFSQVNHPLASSGIAGFLVIHYLIGLVVETVMTVRLVSQVGHDGATISSAIVPANMPQADDC